MFFVSDSVPDWYKNQEMCDRVVSEDPFLIVYYPGRYKTQRMCDEAVDDCLAELKFFLIGLLQVKCLKNLKILYMLKMIANQRHILAVDPDKINCDNDNNFDEDDPDTIIHVRLLAWPSKFGKRKALKKA